MILAPTVSAVVAMMLTSDPTRLAWAMAIVVGYVAFSLGLMSVHWRRARRAADAARRAFEDSVTDGAPLLIVHASQTGYAAELAEQTASSLRAVGAAPAVVDIRHVDLHTLERTRHVLFVASTTGEGDAPDGAERFVRTAMRVPATLPDLEYGVLALGDRSYTEYCAFGFALDTWLRSSGATPLFDTVDVDGADTAALEIWRNRLRASVGADASTWRGARYEPWRLAARTRLNPGSPGGPAYHVVLEADHAASWQAGDVAVVRPEQPAAAVAALLDSVAADGSATVLEDGERLQLARALARRQLPVAPEAVEALRGLDPQSLADRLARLPHREYSIASVPASGRIDLLVRQARFDDGRLGIGSGWLTAHAPIGSVVQVRIRENRAFHGPEHDCPVILIGNGTGLAGLRAHIAARATAARHRNWLLFGERTAAHDFHFRDDVQRWQQKGVLARVDVAFSRDEGDRRYVQDLVRGAADEIRRWVAEGAAIYVCGSRQGMAAGVTAALNEVLGASALETLTAEGRYRRDVY